MLTLGPKAATGTVLRSATAIKGKMHNFLSAQQNNVELAVVQCCCTITG